MKTLFVKWIFKAIMRAIERKHDLKKIDKYVNKPNILDKKMAKVEKEIRSLKKNSHPRADWVCLECGCKAKRKETPKMRRKRRRSLKKEKRNE